MQNQPIQTQQNNHQHDLGSVNDIEFEYKKLQTINSQKIKIQDERKDINEEGLIVPKNEQQTSKTTMVENKKLRKINKDLKSKLELFEKKLDEAMKKKSMSEKKAKQKQEKLQTMSIKNVYKQCEIYKKQISILKKKQAMYQQDRRNQLNTQIKILVDQKQQLLQQMKILKKIHRQQEKNSKDVIDFNYPKFMRQLDQLKYQNKKLSEKILQNQQQQKLNGFTVNYEVQNKKQVDTKTALTKKIQQERIASQIALLKIKAEKDNKAIAYLISENKKITQLNENLDLQMKQKDKQIILLRDRLTILKKPVKAIKIKQQKASNKISIDEYNRCQGIKSQHVQLQEAIGDISVRKQKGKYPRLVQAGVKKQGAYKWNHHEFSSKIKEVCIWFAQDGMIKQVNFRYEKGQPTSQNTGGQFSKFSCEINTEEYIASIQGGFNNQILRYLTLVTSRGRVGSFPQQKLEALQYQTFVFGSQEKEYPGAFFGENSENGINRIGCFMELNKKNDGEELKIFNV